MTPEELDTKAAEWDAKQAAALSELEELEAGAGADLLDDPSVAESLAGRLGALRARMDMAGRAAVEARSRAHSERVAAVRAEADALTPAVERARKALNEHDAKRDKLRKALEDFTGLPYFFEVPEPTGPRALRPREVLESALTEVLTLQARAREHADSVAADPDWVPPEVAEGRRLRRDWEAAIVGVRQIWADLEAKRAELEAECAARFDPRVDTSRTMQNGKPWIPQWFTFLKADITKLEDGVAGFERDVEFFRGQGVDIDQDDVDALMVEFGLAPAPSAAAEADK